MGVWEMRSCARCGNNDREWREAKEGGQVKAQPEGSFRLPAPPALASSPPCSCLVDRDVVLWTFPKLPRSCQRVQTSSFPQLHPPSHIWNNWEVTSERKSLLPCVVSIITAFGGSWMTTQHRDTRHLCITVEASPEQGF